MADRRFSKTEIWSKFHYNLRQRENIEVLLQLGGNYIIIMTEIQFKWDNANLLVVCHCYRENDTIIRIISARRATKTETVFYKNSI